MTDPTTPDFDALEALAARFKWMLEYYPSVITLGVDRRELALIADPLPNLLRLARRAQEAEARAHDLAKRVRKMHDEKVRTDPAHYYDGMPCCVDRGAADAILAAEKESKT